MHIQLFTDLRKNSKSFTIVKKISQYDSIEILPKILHKNRFKHLDVQKPAKRRDRSNMRQLFTQT